MNVKGSASQAAAWASGSAGGAWRSWGHRGLWQKHRSGLLQPPARHQPCLRAARDPQPGPGPPSRRRRGRVLEPRRRGSSGGAGNGRCGVRLALLTDQRRVPGGSQGLTPLADPLTAGCGGGDPAGDTNRPPPADGGVIQLSPSGQIKPTAATPGQTRPRRFVRQS